MDSEGLNGGNRPIVTRLETEQACGTVSDMSTITEIEAERGKGGRRLVYRDRAAFRVGEAAVFVRASGGDGGGVGDSLF